jgi:hypothetical protein
MGREIEQRKPWELHRALAEWNILSQHILPLLTCHANDDPEVRVRPAGAAHALLAARARTERDRPGGSCRVGRSCGMCAALRAVLGPAWE